MSYISRRGDQSAVQSSHSVPTPRLGGVAIFAAIALGSFLISGGFGAATSLLLLCAATLFAGGSARISATEWALAYAWR